jgi:hypothetical protein
LRPSLLGSRSRLLKLPSNGHDGMIGGVLR